MHTCIYMNEYEYIPIYIYMHYVDLGVVFFVNGIIYVPQCISPKYTQRASQVVPVVKNLPTSAGDVRDVGSIPG